MAVDAQSLPYDITWQRLAWSADMVDRSYGGGLPPMWRSSMGTRRHGPPGLQIIEVNP